MAVSSLVITGSGAETSSGTTVGTLFNDLRFFLVQRMPSRSKYVKDIEKNGGRVVKLESQADYVVADHLRKDAPAGSYSYKLIDAALASGEFPDPSEHAIRPPGAVREVGSTSMAKGTRTAFTVDDDRILWDWVERAKEQGYAVKGNEIYKQLEAENPRHTFQSWRDRYIKQLIKRPPVGVIATTPSLSAPPVTDDNHYIDLSAEGHGKFSIESFDKLMSQAEDIESIAEELWEVAWESFSNVNDEHTQEQWVALWTLKVLPAYRARLVGSSKGNRDMYETEVPNSESSAQKRKQCADTDSANEGRSKRQRIATPQLVALEDGQDRPAHAIDEPLPESSSGATKSSKSRTEQTNWRTRRPDVENIVTSDLNEAASLQIQKEAATTSYLNDVARSDSTQATGTGAQMHRDPKGKGPMKRDEDARSREEGLFVDHERSVVPEGEAAEDDEEERMRSLEKTTPRQTNGSPLALTVANLASQQAQHESPTLRGIDLPRDDVNMSQASFAEYLQNILPGNMQAKLETKHEGISPEDERQGQLSTPIRPTLRELFPAEQPEMSANISRVPREGKGHDKAQRCYSIEEQKACTSENALAAPSPQHTAAEVDPDIELSTQALISERNEATSSARRASGSETRDFGDLALPDFTEIVGNDDKSTAGEYRDADQHNHRNENGDSNDDDDDDDDGDDIDLTIAEPDGGFDVSNPPPRDGYVDPLAHPSVSPGDNIRPQPHSVEEISSQQSSDSLSPDSTESTPRLSRPAEGGKRPHALETQDILNAETQKPDLTFSPPSEGDDESNEPFAESPRSAQLTARKEKGKARMVDPQPLDSAGDVNAWVSKMVLRGHQQLAAINALQRTSMRQDLALLVLVEARMGNGLPSDVPGIWSEEEDGILESGDAHGLAMLKDKHGWHEMEARMMYLEDWRALA